MLMKSKIIVIVVAAIMIFAGFYVYTQLERNNNSPEKPLNVYPPDYHIVVNSTYNIPNSNATYSNGYYTECITHFYVGSNVNFSNLCVGLCGKDASGYVIFINKNKSAQNDRYNETVLCLNKGHTGSANIYGGHNKYLKSPRGLWAIVGISNGSTNISVKVCNYAGNHTFNKVRV